MKVSPSFLTADFQHLHSEILSIQAAKWLHFDVMDGLFVPNKTYDEHVLAEIRKYSRQYFDCHLMIENPDEHLQKYIDAGADSVTFHIEAHQKSVENTIRLIRQANKAVGISIKPDTLVNEIYPYLKDVDLILIMSVEPGKGGQRFMTSSLEKIKLLADIRSKEGYQFAIEVDGGINNETIKLVEAAGADVVVVGSYLFNQADRNSAIKELENES